MAGQPLKARKFFSELHTISRGENPPHKAIRPQVRANDPPEPQKRPSGFVKNVIQVITPEQPLHPAIDSWTSTIFIQIKALGFPLLDKDSKVVLVGFTPSLMRHGFTSRSIKVHCIHNSPWRMASYVVSIAFDMGAFIGDAEPTTTLFNRRSGKTPLCGQPLPLVTSCRAPWRRVARHITTRINIVEEVLNLLAALPIASCEM